MVCRSRTSRLAYMCRKKCVCSKDSFYYFVKLNNVRFYGVFSGISARTRKRIKLWKENKNHWLNKIAKCVDLLGVDSYCWAESTNLTHWKESELPAGACRLFRTFLWTWCRSQSWCRRWGLLRICENHIIHLLTAYSVSENLASSLSTSTLTPLFFPVTIV